MDSRDHDLTTGSPVEPELFTPEMDPSGTSLGPSLSRAMQLSAERMAKVIAEYDPTHIIATVSGGRDSAAEVAVAMEMGIKIDLILHCRTGTGIPETTQHVLDHYGNLGPNFVMADAGEAYERYVMRKGFFGFGRGAHNFSYRILKADPMRAAISREIRQRKRGVRPLLLNGARALESDNRRLNLKETRLDKGNLWANIIHDWSAGDRDNYLRINKVPINPVAVQLCRSGECMCGTYQTAQERAEASALYPHWGAWIDDLDRRARAKFGFGWGEPFPRPHDPKQIEMFQPMCMGCSQREEAAA